jgi:Protein of unknown function (DUF669)
MAVSWQNLMKEAEAGGGSFEPLPIGEYSVVIDEATHSQTQSGKLMFKAKMKVEGGPHDGRIVWTNFTVSPESPTALSIFFQQMRTLGLDSNFFAAQPSEDIIASNLTGKRCTVVLSQREWNGQMRNDVKSIKPALGGAVAPPAPAPTASAQPAAVSTPTAAAASTAPASPF